MVAANALLWKFFKKSIWFRAENGAKHYMTNDPTVKDIIRYAMRRWKLRLFIS